MGFSTALLAIIHCWVRLTFSASSFYEKRGPFSRYQPTVLERIRFDFYGTVHGAPDSPLLCWAARIAFLPD